MRVMAGAAVGRIDKRLLGGSLCAGLPPPKSRAHDLVFLKVGERASGWKGRTLLFPSQWLTWLSE